MLARPHPVFGDWCYCQPGDSQRLLDRQLSYRDAALRDNPEFSGMPPEFEQWFRHPLLFRNLKNVTGADAVFLIAQLCP